MEDKICKDIFTQKERWEYGIDVGVGKKIDLAEMNLYTSPKFRAFLYSQITSGKWVAVKKDNGELKIIITDRILPPHAAEIPKKDSNEMRTVYVCENLDRVILSLYNDYLFEKLKHRIHPACKSYQHGIGTSKVVKELVAQSIKTNNKVIVVKTDMRKMFDSIGIEWIDREFDCIDKELGKSYLTDAVRNLYHQNLCFDVSNKLVEHFFSIGQGIATASYLCDAILYDVDKYMSENFNIYYVRYADDILLVGEECEKALVKLEQMLSEKGLALNPKKTELITRDIYYKFLGFSIRGPDISLSKSRIKDFQSQIESRTINHYDFNTVVTKDEKWHIYNKKNKRYSNKSYSSKKECINALNKQRYKVALRKVIEFLYVGNGEYSWATSVLTTINVQKDIDTLNMFVIDCLRAVLTGKTKVGGLGYENNKDNGVINRGTGTNVTANRLKTDKLLDVFLNLILMRDALITDKDVYAALIRTMMINLNRL